MGRLARIVNFTCTNKDTWYKAFDESDYKNNKVKEIKVKLQETSNADHFRYAYVSAPSTYMTSSAGFTVLKDVKKLYVYVPDYDTEVIEIEVIYL